MKLLPHITLLFVVLLAPIYLFSQEEGGIEYESATINDEYCVSLNTDVSISEYYLIDISHLHLHSEKEAKGKFGFICNNLLTYTVDFEAEKAYLQVHLDRTSEPKDIVWWNDYINSLCGL